MIEATGRRTMFSAFDIAHANYYNLRPKRQNWVEIPRPMFPREPSPPEPENWVYVPPPKPKDGVIIDEPEEEEEDNPTLYTLEEMFRARAELNEKLAAGKTVTIFDVLRPFKGSDYAVSPPRDQRRFFFWRGRTKNDPNGDKMWLFDVPPVPKVRVR